MPEEQLWYESGDRGCGLEREEESQKSGMGPLEAALEKEMPAYFHLKPGQKGTKQYMEKYGDALVGVRYRYDKARGLLLKTVELVIEEETPKDPARRRRSRNPDQK
jgi:hypothetical protein